MRREGDLMKLLKSFSALLIAVLITFPVRGQFTSAGLEGHVVEDLKIHGSMMYAATDSGMYRTDVSNNTSDWTRIGFEGDHVKNILVLSADTLLAGTWEHQDQDSVFLWRSVDGGASWQAFQNGFGSDSTTRRTIDMEQAGAGNDTLFATNGYDMYRSVDQGNSWSKSLDMSNQLYFITTAYYDKQMVYSGGQTGFGRGVIWRSADGGEQWEGLANSSQTMMAYRDMGVLPHQPDSAVSAAGTNVWVSGDRGSSWSKQLYFDGYDFTKVSVSTENAGAVYAGGKNRAQWWNDDLALFKSTNSGDTWGVISDSEVMAKDIRSMVVYGATSPEQVYMGTENGIYVYDNTEEPTPVRNYPTVQILTPEDGSDRYYLEETNQWYQGVELSFKGSDKDGRIIEYGWAIGSDSYTWTNDTSLVLSPDQFGSTGTYNIRVTARDEDSLMAKPDTARINLVRPSRDQGILIVDGTNESDFDRTDLQLEDSYVDSLYHAWVGKRGRTHWDISEKGLPGRGELGKYKLVIWHSDNWYAESSDAHKVGEYKKQMADYLDVGGDVIIGGWKVLKSMYPALDKSIQFEEDKFARKYLGIMTAERINTSPPGDMVGAFGVDGFQDMTIDSNRTDGYPVSFYDNLVDVIFVKDYEDSVKPIYNFQCRPECSNPQYRGQVMAQVNNRTHFQVAFFGFPLTFMKEDQAGQAMLDLLTEMGYQETALPGRKESPQTYSLRQNYPNPFNPTTQIRFSLPEATPVELTVYDMLGREVTTLLDKQMSAGKHLVTFSGTGLSSGVYLYQIEADDFTQTRKMLLVK